MSDRAPSDVLVRVEDLRKHYGPIRAVDGISFEVRRGDVLGFLGPNGAGKTTAMKLVTGFLEPDTGSIEVAGLDVALHPIEARRRLGYLPENAPAYGEMTVDGFLRFVAEARGVAGAPGAIDRVVDATGLRRVRHQTVETLSKGFKRRVGLAQAMIHDPEILILDEPTDGLDPNQKVLIQDLIANLSQDRCVILSTHILDEVEKVCNRAIILSQGRILVDSTPADLVAQAPGHHAVRVILVNAADVEPLRERLLAQPWCRDVEAPAERTLEIHPTAGANALIELPACLAGIEVAGLHQREGRLDDVFRAVTKGVAA
ncbi:MAG TPA: ATP-binding cassette domain-containing protein [Thermoanaerobaculia bacterium]|nr:ATP-binding cassette domain-containing protein [Thermoanaerobaculia bacterium]